MKTIRQFLNNLKKINVDREAKQAVARTSKDYIELNTEQITHGKMPDKTRIGKYRNRSYARMKNQMNSLPGLGNVDLILTGKFVGSMELELDGDVLRVEADDPNGLVEKYGSPFGLDPESRKEYVEIVRPIFIDQIKSKL